MKQIRPFRLAIIPLLLAGCGGGGEPVIECTTRDYGTTIETRCYDGSGSQGNTESPGSQTPPTTDTESGPIGTPPPNTPRPEPVVEPAPIEPEPIEPAPAPAPIEPEPVPAPEPPPSSGSEDPSRFAYDMPDVTTQVQQVKIVYAVPQGATDRQFDMNGTLDRAARSINNWLSEKAGVTLRFDQHQGSADVMYFELPYPDSYYDSYYGGTKRQAIEDALFMSGHYVAGKKYLVYYEGYHPQFCGDAPPIDSGGNSAGSVAVVYIDNDLCYRDGFGQQFGYLEAVSLHEVLHLFGAEHTNNPDDIMYTYFFDYSPFTTVDPSVLHPNYIER